MQASLNFSEGFVNKVAESHKHQETAVLHVERVHMQYVKEVKAMKETDEDLCKEDVVEA